MQDLVELTAGGREAARQAGMTDPQFDAVQSALGDIGAATHGLREAEIMSTLEAVGQSEYLIAPGKAFDEAYTHFQSDTQGGRKTTPVSGDAGARTFEVTDDAGNRLRISERAAKPGEVTTRTTATANPGGAPPEIRPQEIATRHGIDIARLPVVEQLYRTRGKAFLEWLDALGGRPGLANRLLGHFGDKAMDHIQATPSGQLSIPTDIDLSPGSLDALSDADISKLVDVAKNKGPNTADYEYFESTSSNGGKPGARLRFKSRVTTRATKIVSDILASLHLSPTDPRAKLFENVSDQDANRLWDLWKERAYSDANVRRSAAEWALSSNPSNVREFVARLQFFDAEVSRQGAQLFLETNAEYNAKVAEATAAKARALDPGETRAISRLITMNKLGRALNELGPAAKRQADIRALEKMGQTTTHADGTTTTEGASAADAAWKTNTDAQTGRYKPGPLTLGAHTDAQLPAILKAQADSLNFADSSEAAYHAHKHAGELPARPAPANEMTTYTDAARAQIKNEPGVVRQNQNGSRSVIFEGGGMRTIVNVGADGTTSIATFGSAN
jgi:hypothetical protein